MFVFHHTDLLNIIIFLPPRRVHIILYNFFLFLAKIIRFKIIMYYLATVQKSKLKYYNLIYCIV